MGGPVLTSGMQAVASNPALGVFMGIEIDLPASTSGGLTARTVRLLDGSGQMTWGGHTWTGQDADYGVWQGMSETIDEQIATQAPKFRTSLTGLTNTAIQQLCQPESQGAPLTLFYGYFSFTSGQPITDPVAWFIGMVDVCNIQVDDSQAMVTIDVASVAELLLLPNDGARLNSAFHHLFFPGENGFAFVDNVQHQIPWGLGGPRPDQVTDVTNWDSTPKLPVTSLKF